MKSKILLYASLSIMPFVDIDAQNSTDYFHSIGKDQKKGFALSDSVSSVSDGCFAQVDSVGEPRAETLDLSSLTIEELESYIKRYEGLINKASDKTSRQNNSRILSYYNGESHNLTLSNVMKVAEEVGLSNLSFVMAQAVLETGYFKSRVCLEYHNLFGLYDSRRHDYYHFARWEDSVIGYKKFIQYRYKGGNYLKFLKRIGYAEDPGYTVKVGKIAMRLYEKIKSGKLNQ